MNHHQAQPIEQSRDRQHERVGIGGPPAQHQMEADREEQQTKAVLDQVRRKCPAHREPDVQVGHEHDRDGQQQEHQLDIASGARTEGGDCAHGLEVPQLPPVALVLWHWIDCARRSATSRRASWLLVVLTVEATWLR